MLSAIQTNSCKPVKKQFDKAKKNQKIWSWCLRGRIELKPLKIKLRERFDKFLQNNLGFDHRSLTTPMLGNGMTLFFVFAKH